MAEVIDIVHVLSYEANTDAIKDVNAAFGTQFKQMQALQDELAKLQLQLDKTAKSEIANRKQIEQLIAANKRQYDNLAVSVGKQATANDKLNKSLVQTGKSLSNVSMAGSQLLREAPAFTFSLQTGILALSNNIPILTDAIKKAKDEGDSAKDIFKALGGSLFTLTGLITSAVAILTIFGDKIFASSEASKEAEDAYQKYAKTVRDTTEGVTVAIRQQENNTKLLIQTINDTSLSIQRRTDAYLEFQRQHPDILAGVTMEEFLQSKLLDTINKQTVAVERLKGAKASQLVLQEQEAIAANERQKAEDKLNETLRKRAEYQGKLDRGEARFEPSRRDRNVDARIDSYNRIAERDRELLDAARLRERNIEAQLRTANATITQLNRQAPGTGETRQQEIDDYNDKLKEAARLAKEQREEWDKIQKAIKQAIEDVSRTFKIADIISFTEDIAKQISDQTAEEKRKRDAEPPLVSGITAHLFPSGKYTVEELAQQKRDAAAQDKKDEDRKKNDEKAKDAIKDNLDYAFNQTINTLQAIYEAQIYYLDKEIALRQDRVEKAVELAEKGNTAILESERERLREAQEERERVGQRQIQLNSILRASEAALVVVQSLQAITNAASAGDAYSAPVRIALTAAALVAALSAVFGATVGLVQAFKDGEIDIDGPGTGTSDSIRARLSKGESVMTAAETKEYKPYLEAMRDGSFYGMINQRQPIVVGGGGNYKTLEKKLDGVIEAIGLNQTRVNAHIDERGISIMTQKYSRYEQNRFR